MFDFHEKRRLKSYIFSKYVAGVVFLCACLLLVSVYGRYVAERKMAAKRADMANELHMLEARAAALESEVKRLQSDRGIEEEIRDKYEVSKAGEKVVVILGDDDARVEDIASTSDVEPSEETGGHWWMFWQ